MKIDKNLIYKYPFSMACYFVVVVLYIIILLWKNGFGSMSEMTLTEGFVLIFSMLMVILGIFVMKMQDLEEILLEVKK